VSMGDYYCIKISNTNSGTLRYGYELLFSSDPATFYSTIQHNFAVCSPVKNSEDLPTSLKSAGVLLNGSIHFPLVILL